MKTLPYFKILFDIVTKCSRSEEQRLMIDLQALGDAYAEHEISDVEFVRGPQNPADGMTNIGKRSALERLISLSSNG